MLLIGFSAVLALAARDVIDLTAASLQRPGILAPNTEQNHLGHVSEIESNAPAVRSTIFADFMPDDIGFLVEAPCLHHRKAVRQQGIRDPQIEVRNVGADLAYGKIADVLQGQGCVASKSSVLGGDLSSLVLKLPGRIGQDRPEAPALGRREQVCLLLPSSRCPLTDGA